MERITRDNIENETRIERSDGSTVYVHLGFYTHSASSCHICLPILSRRNYVVAIKIPTKVVALWRTFRKKCNRERIVGSLLEYRLLAIRSKNDVECQTRWIISGGRLNFDENNMPIFSERETMYFFCEMLSTLTLSTGCFPVKLTVLTCTLLSVHQRK